MLEDKGLSVIPAQCPQTSFSADVAAVWRIIDVQDGDVLLVAHSWDGAVITETCRHPRVRGAIYIASGSDSQQALGEWVTEFPAMGNPLAPDETPSMGTTWTWRSKPTWFVYGEQGDQTGPSGAPMPAQIAEVADVIAQAAAELAGQDPAQVPRPRTPAGPAD
jgi:pimeloyl-ACP methyl ester carboxylesterase